MTSMTTTVTTPTDKQILITREFDAPRDLVFKAWTTPELVERWWSGRRGHMKSVDIDLRVGGAWRYVMEAQEGFEVAFHGEFREIEAPARLVTTEVYEMPDAPPLDSADEPLNIVTFDESDGKTTLNLLVETTSTELRDTILSSGMEQGMEEQFEILDELTVSLS